MRGKGYDVVSRLCRVRITPACAGKSIIEATSRALNEDHPRVCGEKNSASVIRNCKQGSPPRMRGKGEGQGNSHQERRITPAYAGKSRIRRACTDRHRDHPRMCGEKCEAYARIHGMVGSPPRMRGKVKYEDLMYEPKGITPAYAGKRLKRFRSTVSPVAIVPLFPSVCNKPVVSDGSPAGRDAPLFLPAENAVPASPAYNLRSL